MPRIYSNSAQARTFTTHSENHNAPDFVVLFLFCEFYNSLWSKVKKF